MSHWNHRVIRTVEDGEEWLAIHEVHYEDDGSLFGYTMLPVEVSGASKEDLILTLERMRKALDEPYLTPEDFK